MKNSYRAIERRNRAEHSHAPEWPLARGQAARSEGRCRNPFDRSLPVLTGHEAQTVKRLPYRAASPDQLFSMRVKFLTDIKSRLSYSLMNGISIEFRLVERALDAETMRAEANSGIA
ncbi:hypothetical protein [Burkholderia gladioli]|uniref:hypothetical protein n=1 Tax=Burkholderia gladioli TaxID=28095 RepID=UPI00164006DA|nr:hypothetical protein [Burkholderia gladioli]